MKHDTRIFVEYIPMTLVTFTGEVTSQCTDDDCAIWSHVVYLKKMLGVYVPSAPMY